MIEREAKYNQVALKSAGKFFTNHSRTGRRVQEVYIFTGSADFCAALDTVERREERQGVEHEC
jgi:hypothetical protein